MPVLAQTTIRVSGKIRWDTTELRMGDLLLMVSICRHHCMPASEGAKDGLQSTLFILWTPDR